MLGLKEMINIKRECHVKEWIITKIEQSKKKCNSTAES